MQAPKGAAFDEGTQPYQVVKIPVIEKDVEFRYINFIPPLPWAMEVCSERN
jgi:hypothetical protein